MVKDILRGSLANPNFEAAEIKAELDRIMASSNFQRSKRLCHLLRYLVTETLEGRGDRIKATSIAVDVYGRDETFDQQADTIVRVEAGRLRRHLDEYYRTAGQHDSILIEIPKGGYRPTLMPNPAKTPEPPSSTEAAAVVQPPRGDRRILLIVAVIASITFLITTWTLVDNWRTSPRTPEKVAVKSMVNPAPIEKPFIMVMPLTTVAAEG